MCCLLMNFIQLDAMNCKWTADSFNLSEASVLYEFFMNMSNIKDYSRYSTLITTYFFCIFDTSSLEIVGRFPTDEEADDYHVSRFVPVWLPPVSKNPPEFIKAVNHKIWYPFSFMKPNFTKNILALGYQTSLVRSCPYQAETLKKTLFL